MQTFLCRLATQPEEFQLLEETTVSDGFSAFRETQIMGGWHGLAQPGWTSGVNKVRCVPLCVLHTTGFMLMLSRGEMMNSNYWAVFILVTNVFCRTF